MSLATATVEPALEILRGLGVDGEVYFESSRRVKVSCSGGAPESVEDRRDRGVGIRVFEDGRVGFAFTTDLSPAAIRQAATLAREIAAHTGRDAAWRLAPPEEVRDLPFGNEDPRAGTFTIARRLEAAVAIEEAARAADPRIRKTRESAVSDFQGEVRIAHTRGLDASYRYGRAVAHLEVTASEGASSQVGYHVEFGLGIEDLDPAEIGRTAAAKALAKLGAIPASTGQIAAVLDREVVAGILDELAPAFSAHRVLKGTSPLAGKLGAAVASPAITLVDDPRLAGGFGSVPADGEGFPTRRVVLIEEGRLGAYLHNTYTGAKMGSGGPGNSVRLSYSVPPQIGPANLVLLPGADAPQDLWARAGDGVLITEVMGLHTVDPITGDFSIGGSGRRIEAGRLGAAVDRLAISGNLLRLLESVESVGSDLKLFPGGGGAPSLLLRDLSVAGAG